MVTVHDTEKIIQIEGMVEEKLSERAKLLHKNPIEVKRNAQSAIIELEHVTGNYTCALLAFSICIGVDVTNLIHFGVLK